MVLQVGTTWWTGYKLDKGYMTPYCDTRCRTGEKFNYAHSGLRTAVEHSFGVLKERWEILRDVPEYDVDMQKI